jgi:hypothetical protein
MADKEIEVENLRKYIKVIEKIAVDNLPKTHLFYRGQTNIEKSLLPSAFRIKPDEKWETALNREKSYFYEAMTRFPNEFSNMSNLDRLAKMQHYGLPTRLLDITSNPLTALFFACEESRCTCHVDGGVFVFQGIQKPDQNENESKGKSFYIPSFDKGHVAMLSALPKLDYKRKEIIREFAEYMKTYPNNNLITDAVLDEGNKKYALKTFITDRKKNGDKEIKQIIKARSKEDIYNCEQSFL